MGTSSSNGGPSGKSSLLPSYYNPSAADNNATGTTASAPAPNAIDGSVQITTSPQPSVIPTPPRNTPTLTGDWTVARGAMTRFANRTAGSSVRKAAQNYVRTLGGSRGASRSASRGISSGRGLVSFLGSVSRSIGGNGLTPTLTQLGLSGYIGHSSEETLAKIADAIAPIGATNDEAIARDAVITTLDLLYTKILMNGGDITALESLTPEMIKETVIEYVGIYIFKKWVYELGIAVEKNSVTEKQAIQMENEIKDFINAEVKLSLAHKDVQDFDLNSPPNQQIIETIFTIAYSTLEQ